MIRYLGPGVGFLDDRYVNVTGDTMTGALIITPTADGTEILRVNNAAGAVVFDVDTTNARVGVGGLPGEPLDVYGNVLLVGSDSSAASRTDATIKLSRVSMPHYTNAEEAFTLFAGAVLGGTNIAVFGGGVGDQNAASYLGFFTAANSTTLEGSERMRLHDSGGFAIGGAFFSTDPGTNNVIIEGTLGVNITAPVATFHVVETSPAAVSRGIIIGQHSTNANAPQFIGRKSRGTVGSPTIAADGDFGVVYISEIYDGAAYQQPSFFGFLVNGAVSAGSIPTDIVFYAGTSTASRPERMRITSGGVVVIGESTVQTNANYLQIGGDWTFKETTTPTADAAYGKIWTDANNELWFQSGDGSNHLLHGDAFSNIWYHGSTTGTMTVDVTISAQNAFAQIDSFTVVGHEDDLNNVVGSISTNDLTLSAIGSGEYEISFHGSVTATGGADKEMMLCLGITLATPKDITDVTDNLVTPIVITSTAHGLENGDMVEIVGVLGNTAANGSFIVSSKTDNTFEIIDLSGGATTGNGDFDAGSPTGDVTIEYPGNMIIHEDVRGAKLDVPAATGLHILANSDVLALYVANLDGTTNLTIAAVSLDANRIGD